MKKNNENRKSQRPDADGKCTRVLTTARLARDTARCTGVRAVWVWIE